MRGHMKVKFYMFQSFNASCFGSCIKSHQQDDKVPTVHDNFQLVPCQSDNGFLHVSRNMLQ